MTKKPGGESASKPFPNHGGREDVNVTAATAAANPQIRYSANEFTCRNSPLFRRTAADAAFRLLFVVVVRRIVFTVRGSIRMPVSCLVMRRRQGVCWHCRARTVLVVVERFVLLRRRAAEGVVVDDVWVARWRRLLGSWSSGVDLHRFVCFVITVSVLLSASPTNSDGSKYLGDFKKGKSLKR